MAMMVATTYFTRGARVVEADYHWRLKLHDRDSVVNWLSKYGTWDVDGKSGLWIPSNNRGLISPPSVNLDQRAHLNKELRFPE